LVEVKRGNRNQHCDRRQDAKNADLAKKRHRVECLQGIVERSIPFIDSDADIHVAQI
jgi:hypothetical protein